MNAAAYTALSRIGGPVRSASIRGIKQKYKIPKKERVNDAIRLMKSVRPPSLTITTRGKPPGLQHYAVGRQTKTGVSVLVRKDRGRKKFRHGFLAPGASGKGAGLWHREGEKVVPVKGRYAGRKKKDGGPLKRQPLTRHFGPDIVGMMKREGVKEIRAAVDARWEKEFGHQLEWQMKKK